MWNLWPEKNVHPEAKNRRAQHTRRPCRLALEVPLRPYGGRSLFKSYKSSNYLILPILKVHARRLHVRSFWTAAKNLNKNIVLLERFVLISERILAAIPAGPSKIPLRSIRCSPLRRVKCSLSRSHSDTTCIPVNHRRTKIWNQHSIGRFRGSVHTLAGTHTCLKAATLLQWAVICGRKRNITKWWLINLPQSQSNKFAWILSLAARTIRKSYLNGKTYTFYARKTTRRIEEA